MPMYGAFSGYTRMSYLPTQNLKNKMKYWSSNSGGKFWLRITKEKL